VAVLFSISLASSVAAQQVILGILEEVSGESTGGPNSYAVRSVFLKGSAGWQAYPSNCRNPQCLKTISSKFPAKTLWTITFDGKSLGHLTAQTPREFQFYADVGLQKITSTGSIPSVGKPSVDFGGFDAAPVHRPLVANSQPYFRDPDVWIPEVGLRVGDQRAMNRRGIKSSEINRGFADGWNRACAGNFLKPNVRVELKFSWSLCSQMSQGFAVEGDGPKSLGGKLRGDGFEALWVTAIAGIG